MKKVCGFRGWLLAVVVLLLMYACVVLGANLHFGVVPWLGLTAAALLAEGVRVESPVAPAAQTLCLHSQSSLRAYFAVRLVKCFEC